LLGEKNVFILSRRMLLAFQKRGMLSTNFWDQDHDKTYARKVQWLFSETTPTTLSFG
jgi:hypothetical protein